MKTKINLRKIIRMIKYYITKKETIYPSRINNYLGNSVFNDEDSILYVIDYNNKKDFYRIIVQPYNQRFIL
jgi:hypothetical protein